MADRDRSALSDQNPTQKASDWRFHVDRGFIGFDLANRLS
jgi:hypothetical protein